MRLQYGTWVDPQSEESPEKKPATTPVFPESHGDGGIQDTVTGLQKLGPRLHFHFQSIHIFSFQLNFHLLYMVGSAP